MINVLRQKDKDREEAVEWWLVEKNNVIELHCKRAEDTDPDGWCVISIEEGILYVTECVGDDVGLVLDNKSRITIEKGD